MFRTLRSQLLVSYVVVILLTLLIAGIALLAALVIDAPALRTLEQLRPIERANHNSLPTDETARDIFLQRIAQVNGIRVLRVQPNQSVVFDSAGMIEPGRILSFGPNSFGSRTLADGVRMGRFRTVDGVWVFVATPPDELGWTVYAQRINRGAFVAEIGADLIRPMLQAGLAGAILAALFAFVISQSVSQPLRRTAEAAHHIAEGDFTAKAPLEGPQEVQDVAQMFNYMAQRVEQNQRAQREFLANVSHDLKTPLTSIQGFSQALVDGATPDPQHAATIIHDEATRMRRMVDELLDLARIESGMASLTYGVLDLTTLLTGVINSLEPQAHQNNIEVSFTGASSVKIEADGDRLVQAFTNLIDNAITHAQSGVRVKLTTELSSVQIQVTDDGVGILPDEQDQIFERFYQVDKARSSNKRQGSGLGLTITREIIRAHGGNITIESTIGEGTSFTARVPLTKPHKPQDLLGKQS